METLLKIFLTTGAIYYTLEIGRHIFTIYIAWQMNQHDKYCEDCEEQALINEIRNKK
jgi:hypothetical protein